MNEKIVTERLLLRPFELSDAESVARICNNVKLYRGTLSLPYPYTIDHAIGWISRNKENFENDKIYDFAITEKDSGKLVGAIGIGNDQKNKNGELGYWIDEQCWRNGYATEATKAIIDYVFNVKGFHRVFARHYKSNPASGKVMIKTGMSYEGELKDHILKDGVFETIICYGILNPNRGKK